ncbi:MAG: flagellar basal body rod protein FlgB [Alphaproteobacteria bacterium PA2]|nr:MAG: flagellar basal body rod protein FlgB [Alphaproteobacteria bacterium PA2]
MDITDIPLFAMLKSRMGYLTERQRVIAQNVANADTPNYMPQDLKQYSFQSHMAAVAPPPGPMSVAVTSPMHIAHTATSPNPPKVRSRKTLDTETTLDGNSVVLEDEMLKLTDTRMNYEAAVSFYQKSLNLLKMAARPPSR